MKMTIRQKILAVFLLLTLIVIITTSVVYYHLLCQKVSKTGSLEGVAEGIAQIETEYEKVKGALENIQSEQLWNIHE